MGYRIGIAALMIAGLASAASAQFVNGDFETGDLSGWTVGFTANGTTTIQEVVQYDIDGPGPLGTSFAGRFRVGSVVFVGGVLEGIELTQPLTLNSGVAYTFEVDVTANFSNG